eukprot:TRINITY_DN494_c0_g1_i2.p1 TRINITY_DN494_c0_g1~~TRINITY_DN494_c0_g1_i2.p1  ORF type:complete len:160 (-),score=11.23 TRINITY_DN494_c0_g1_i2:267-722(-)
MIRRPPRSTLSSSSAASDVYKRQLSPCAQTRDWIDIIIDLHLYYYYIWRYFPNGTASMMGETLRKWNQFRDLYAPCVTDDLPVFQAALDTISSATPASLYAQFYDDPMAFIDLMHLQYVAFTTKTDWESGMALGVLFRRLFFGLPERGNHI